MRFSRIAAGAIVAAAYLTGTAAHANDVTHGALNINGSEYVNGVEQKVKCSSSDGNYLDSNGLGQRVFHLTSSNTCPIWNFTGPNDTFTFNGQETNVPAKHAYAFSGVQDPNSSQVIGSAAGLLKCTAGFCPKNQGTIDFSYTDGTNKYVFIGTYKASFPP
jgi:hypothetical protein